MQEKAKVLMLALMTDWGSLALLLRRSPRLSLSSMLFASFHGDRRARCPNSLLQKLLHVRDASSPRRHHAVILRVPVLSQLCPDDVSSQKKDVAHHAVRTE